MTDLTSLRRAYRTGTGSVPAEVAATCERLLAHPDPAVFTALVPAEQARDRAIAAEGSSAGPALRGVPVAVKDNIDVAGLATTGGCPSFGATYGPATRSATAVTRLETAGAVVVAKANLDQFATGLAGTRSPFGTPQNPHGAGWIPGGSSSGSAAAVAAGLVPVALGTDTAGSGRVPAALCGIVGLKPAPGLVPTDGVLPAVASLDCVSVFATTVADAAAALAVLVPRRALPSSRSFGPHPIGVPAVGLDLLGDQAAAATYLAALDRLADAGHRLVPIDLDPFLNAGRLLYDPDGPWLRERFDSVGGFLLGEPADADPVVASIILAAAEQDPARRERARMCHQELRQVTIRAWSSVDALALPTTPTTWMVDEVAADPVRCSADLGTFTTFANLLDLAAISVPSGLQRGGMPAGLQLLAPAGGERLLVALAGGFEAATGPVTAPAPVVVGSVSVVVVGAHLRGQPLEHQLQELGARFVHQTTTSADYRLLVVPGAVPAKPGLVRTPGGGRPIEVEVWELPDAAAFGRFVTTIPAPLGLGRVRLVDGSEVPGFIAEAGPLAGAEDITTFGGWRAWLGRSVAP